MMKCVLCLALVAAVTLSVLPKRTEAKQLLSDDKERSNFQDNEDENKREEIFDRNGDSDLDETEKENEGDKKDDKDDDANEDSENGRKVDENRRETGVGNRRNDNEDNTDEDDDDEQQISLFDRLLAGKDYIDDSFLAEEYYGEDDLYDNVQEENTDNVFNKDKNERKNGEDFENEDEDYYDNEEEVVEEEWTGTNLRNNNQNDLEEEEENDHLSELKDENLGTVSDHEEIYFGTSNSVVIGVIVGAVFLAGLLIGLAIMIVTYRLLAKSRGFVRLSKHDEFSSQTPICKKAFGHQKCDIVSV